MTRSASAGIFAIAKARRGAGGLRLLEQEMERWLRREMSFLREIERASKAIGSAGSIAASSVGDRR